MIAENKIYPTSSGDGYPIAKMSVSYLKDTIAFVKKHNINTEYLPALEHQLVLKQGLVFSNIKETNKRKR